MDKKEKDFIYKKDCTLIFSATALFDYNLLKKLLRIFEKAAL